MYYPNEVRQVAEYGQAGPVDVKQQEVRLAEQLIESLAAKFEPEKYKDEYQDRLKMLIEAKRQGREVAEVTKPQLAPVIDLMEALKKSLAQQEAGPKKPPLRSVEPAQPQKKRKKSTG